MASYGSLVVRAYQGGGAVLPIENVSIFVTDMDGRLLAVRQTDRNGKAGPIPVQVPPKEESLDPNFQGNPFTSVSLSARNPGFAEIDVRNIQLFPGVVTVQNLEMIPLAEFPNAENGSEEFNIPPQNL